jgi:hypothetical protein
MYGKSSTLYFYRRVPLPPCSWYLFKAEPLPAAQNKRKIREVAIIAVLADRGGGCWRQPTKTNKRALLYTTLVP